MKGGDPLVFFRLKWERLSVRWAGKTIDRSCQCMDIALPIFSRNR